MLYQINATRTITGLKRRNDDSSWTTTNQIPTFYLDSNIQGIVDSEHAERIARDVLESGGMLSSVSFSIHAEPFVSIHD